MISKVDMETGNFRAFNHASSLLNSRLPKSFPGSLFSASIVVEKMEAEKRDPGNEVGRLPCYVLTLVHVGSRDDRSLHPSDARVEESVC